MKSARSRPRSSSLPAVLALLCLGRFSACTVDDSYDYRDPGAGAGGEAGTSDGGRDPGGDGGDAGALPWEGGAGGVAGATDPGGAAGAAAAGAAGAGGGAPAEGGQDPGGSTGTGGAELGGGGTDGGSTAQGGAGGELAGGADPGGANAGGAGGESSPPSVVIADETMLGVLAELTLTLDDPDGSVVSVTIDWGDDVETIAASEPETVVTHEYPFVGEPYDVSVTATDDDGNTGPAASTVLTAELPTDDLLLHVPFDGSSVDLVGSTLSSSEAGVYVTDRHGFGERARDFWNGNETGNVSLVSAAHLAAMTESFTLAVWLNNEPASGGFQGNSERIFGQGDWFNLYSPGTGVSMGVLDGMMPDPAMTPASTPTNPGTGWHFYAGVVERLGAGSSEIRLYVDGELASNVAAATTFVNPGTCRLYIGSYAESNQCSDTSAPEEGTYPGYLDDVRVYGRALAPSEVQALFLEGVEP